MKKKLKDKKIINNENPKIKEVAKDEIKEPEDINKEEVSFTIPISPPKLFSTIDRKLAEKLQNKFNYKSINIDKTDPANEIEHFTFNATEKEVSDFLNGGK